MNTIKRVAFGGGCHWCTEAVFQSIKGVEKVEQGYVASINENNSFSEAVIVNFYSECVNLQTLIEIHLLTHNSKVNHSMREKYRSAIYTFSENQHSEAIQLLDEFQVQFDHQLITQVLRFHSFKPSRTEITNYYYKNPKRPFCETFINPKLQLLMRQFSEKVDDDKLAHLKNYITADTQIV